MKELKFDHVFNCDEDTYWDKVFFAEDYNQAMFVDTLKFNRWKLVSSEDGDDKLERVVEVDPPVGDIPKTVKKVIGDNFGYRELGTFDKKTKRYTVNVKTNVMGDKMRINGEIWLEPAGEKKVRRHAKFNVDVKIFGIGKVVEGLIARDMQSQFEEGSAFTNTWIADKGL
ncbi:MAG: DUF2505 family protein [Deltaproteobacteria bacterium]|nr:DUF2505 family protein [Deltaproteobacteria bacterium]MBW2537231.1 DUF2505 family protein [Deltaproteobacteria bacterium]